MPQGLSINIGLNTLDPAAYGNATPLAGCINDANAMQQIADQQGFQTLLFTDASATSSNVLDAISGAARSLGSGDMLLLTYAGHGSQIPDTNNDEPDGQDETWCLYDRMVLDDELYQLWTQFAQDVRIVMISDSCHSGTMLRQMRFQEQNRSVAPFAPPLRAKRGMRSAALSLPASTSMPPATSPMPRPASRTRWLNPASAQQALNTGKRLYDSIQRMVPRNVRDAIQASVLLISGCQDNQFSADGNGHGLFTQRLLEVWDNGAFSGGYRKLHQEILDLMPSEQTPNYMVLGAKNPSFEAQMPFTLTSGGSTAPASSAPSIQGPATLSSSDLAPEFEVSLGANRFYIIEVATDASLFDTSNASDRRDDGNFYGSWSDQNHFSDPHYTLPADVWDRLKGADQLYYRVGSVATPAGWTNYQVSTEDDDYQSAPSIMITMGVSPSEPDTGAPTISGPSTARDSDDAPWFDIGTASAPYFFVEVATDAMLFDGAAHDADRTDETFYGSWSAEELQTGTSYRLPDEVWERLKAAASLYYRVGTTTSESGWDNLIYSTEDAMADQAPFIEIEHARRTNSGVFSSFPPRNMAA
jgi:metacaspase-1